MLASAHRFQRAVRSPAVLAEGEVALGSALKPHWIPWLRSGAARYNALIAKRARRPLGPRDVASAYSAYVSSPSISSLSESCVSEARARRVRACSIGAHRSLGNGRRATEALRERPIIQARVMSEGRTSVNSGGAARPAPIATFGTVQQ